VKYKLIIFDFDGTLADSFPWLVGLFNEMADAYHFNRLGPEKVAILRTYKAAQVMKAIGISIWQAPKIGREIKIRMAREIERVPLFEGIPSVLVELSRNGAELALATSNARTNILKVLGEGNANLFKYMECDISLNGKKASFQRIVRRTGLEKSRILAIGDEIRDLEAARRAGIAFGAVSWGYTDIQTLKTQSPDLVFSKASDILDLLQN